MTTLLTIFLSRQLEALADSGDVLIALSTSGNSQNIINAVKYCKKKEIIIVSLTGFDGGELKKSDLNINIAVDSTQRVQEMHILVGHIICDVIEKRKFFSNSKYFYSS